MLPHRELILSDRRRRRFGFLRLPPALQDEIIAGLDRGKTLKWAKGLIREQGFRLSHNAVSKYYSAVRSARRDYLLKRGDT